MRFEVYPSYKGSGIEWIENIPSGWKVVPLFTALRERQVRNEGNRINNVFSLSYGRIVDRDVDTNHGLLPESFETYQIVEKDDVVLRLTDLQNDQRSLRVGQVKRQGIITSAYLCLAPSERINPDFAYLLLHTYDILKIFYGLGGGVRQSMKFADLKRMPLLVPSSQEQRAIALFLRRETAKIDTLIAKQEKLIALLKEKRQAVITHAVTNGLDPTVPMKRSGVEWLGDVPEHWEVLPFKTAVGFQEGPGIMADDFKDSGIPLLRIACVGGRYATLDGCNYLDPEKVEKKWSHFRVEAGDLLISGSASMGMVSEVTEETEGAIPYTGLIRLFPRFGIAARDFVRAFVISSVFMRQIDLLKAGATIQHFGPTHLRQVKMALPPLEEQLRITQHLSVQLEKIDRLINRAEDAILLQKEHRSALISAAVTGKIDVRDAVLDLQQAA